MSASQNRWTDPDLEQAIADLPLPRARPEFERRVRDRFLGRTSPPRASQAPAPRPTAFEPVPSPQPSRWPRRALVAAALLGALGVWVARFRVPARPTDPGWRLSAPLADADLAVDGELLRVPADIDSYELPSLGTLETREGTVRLRRGRDFLIECPPHSRLEVLHLPAANAEIPRTVLALRSGTARVITGPDFPGGELWIETEAARVQVTGTQFLVEILPEGTCVCCREGVVRVHPRLKPDQPSRVVPGMQHVVLGKNGSIEESRAQPRHSRPLTRLAAFRWD